MQREQAEQAVVLAKLQHQRLVAIVHGRDTAWSFSPKTNEVLEEAGLIFRKSGRGSSDIAVVTNAGLHLLGMKRADTHQSLERQANRLLNHTKQSKWRTRNKRRGF